MKWSLISIYLSIYISTTIFSDIFLCIFVFGTNIFGTLPSTYKPQPTSGHAQSETILLKDINHLKNIMPD